MNRKNKKSLRAERVKRTDTIRWHIFAWLMVFSLAIIIIIWILQVLLLDTFYYRTVKSRMNISARQLLSCSVDELPSTAENIAVNRQLSVRVFRIENIGGERKAYSICHATNSGSILEVINTDALNSIYLEAQNNEGHITKHFSREKIEAHFGEVGGTSPIPVGTEIPERLVHARIQTNAAGDLLYILLDTPLTPLDLTVVTLQNQMVFISIALLLLSTVIAIILAFVISRPLKKLNSAAKELAQGNYHVDFHTDGYREVVELSDTLTYAADELATVDRLQKELLANISHDLRTPLTMIIGYGEVMRDIDGENTPENVQVIIDEAERLTSLVNDLLEISSYQANNEAIIRDAFDIAETVNEVSERYQHLKEKGGYHFIVEGETSAWIFADKKKILQVLCNLINNAVNYAGDDKTIIIRCESNDNNVRISVIDHGQGIPQNEIEHIWQRYYKVNKTHTRGVMGSGLGLSIVRRILELHDARYGVESQEGKGSIFWFELPRYLPELSTNE